ncbi:MAG: fructosamine kinase, partial [Chloroflexi bacterium]
MTLPPALRARLADLLGAPVEQEQPVYGGDINQSARFVCGRRPYFVKWNAQAPADMFPTEAHGLQLLDEARAVRVPRVIAQGDASGSSASGSSASGNSASGNSASGSSADGDCPAFLVLEWIETGSKYGSGQALADFGAALAAMHRHTADQHGLDRDNYIGRLPQPNTPSPRWSTFYRDQRIGYQMALARRLGRLPHYREDVLTRLMERLPELLDDKMMPPSLIHGDLWGGNYMIDNRNCAVLIDPAVCYGHREMDLAMSELFGGFSPSFYEAYFEAYPAPGYPERRALYQLYYILAHLNLFGESYGSRVDAIAA